jgi:hypothetical protein
VVIQLLDHALMMLRDQIGDLVGAFHVEQLLDQGGTVMVELV